MPRAVAYWRAGRHCELLRTDGYIFRYDCSTSTLMHRTYTPLRPYLASRMACLCRGCERQQWPVSVCRRTASPLRRSIFNAQIPEHKREVASHRPVCSVRACWLPRRRCERIQAHNTVTPGIGQRTAIPGSYPDPYAQINTSLRFWLGRICLRAMLAHVGARNA